LLHGWWLFFLLFSSLPRGRPGNHPPSYFNDLKFAADLSPRIVREVENSPVVALKLFFNQAAAWFHDN
jgi:hypothetical protein